MQDNLLNTGNGLFEKCIEEKIDVLEEKYKSYLLSVDRTFSDSYVFLYNIGNGGKPRVSVQITKSFTKEIDEEIETIFRNCMRDNS